MNEDLNKKDITLTPMDYKTNSFLKKISSVRQIYKTNTFGGWTDLKEWFIVSFKSSRFFKIELERAYGLPFRQNKFERYSFKGEFSMKKTIFLFLMIFLVLGSSQVMAYDYGVSVNDTVVWAGDSVNYGGEFTFSVKNYDFSHGYTWSTFCVETTQSLTDSHWGMKVTDIADETTSGKELTDEVAWLYWNFSTGSLFDYNSESVVDQQDLQLAIWTLLGEEIPNYVSTVTSSQFDEWLDLANDAVDNGWTNNGLVQVLQLGNRQDVLVAATNATNQVPEPASMFLLGIGLAGIALVGRKKMKKNI